MPNVNSWMTTTNKAGAWKESIEKDNRSVHFTHRIISEKPSTISVQRGNTTLGPQVVRIEQTRIAPDKDVGHAGREHTSNATLIGYSGHPTITDTDLQSGDKFVHDGKKFEVRQVFPETEGRLEAWLEVQE